MTASLTAHFRHPAPLKSPTRRTWSQTHYAEEKLIWRGRCNGPYRLPLRRAKIRQFSIERSAAQISHAAFLQEGQKSEELSFCGEYTQGNKQVDIDLPQQVAWLSILLDNTSLRIL